MYCKVQSSQSLLKTFGNRYFDWNSLGRLYDNYEGLLDQVKFHSKIIFTKQHLFNCSLLNFGGKLLRSLAKVSIFGHTCKYSYVSYRFL